jgi:predicted small lipoprotein YifL
MFSSLRIITVMPIMLALAGLSACGQKGTLFLAPQSVPYKFLQGSSTDTPTTATLGSAPTPANASSAAK